MARLVCWKKVQDFEKKGKGLSKGRFIQYASKNPKKGTVKINQQDDTYLVTFESPRNSKRFDKKTQALKAARSYMKQRDSC